MRDIDFSYQDKAAKRVLENALDKRYIASVLAACPSAGKTTISHKILNTYTTTYPNARILVLTEGQNTLKNQYLEELQTPNVEILFSYGSLGSKAQVQVGLPQSIDKLEWDSIDLLIVDEAHNFYLADTVQDIIERLRPRHQILMTGSPTKYNAWNQENYKKYGIYYISAEELQKYGVFSAVDMDVARVTYRKNATQTIKEVLSHAVKNGDPLSKVMVACPNIAYAKQVADYLTSVGRKVSISTSANDKDDVQIQAFKQGKTDVLVVVGKGVLGFNDKDITLLIDLKSSSNVDTSYQLFARVLRTHPKNFKKAYWRVADKDYNHQVLMLHKIQALMNRGVFVGFTGKNLITTID